MLNVRCSPDNLKVKTSEKWNASKWVGVILKTSIVKFPQPKKIIYLHHRHAFSFAVHFHFILMLCYRSDGHDRVDSWALSILIDVFRIILWLYYCCTFWFYLILFVCIIFASFFRRSHCEMVDYFFFLSLRSLAVSSISLIIADSCIYLLAANMTFLTQRDIQPFLGHSTNYYDCVENFAICKLVLGISLITPFWNDVQCLHRNTSQRSRGFDYYKLAMEK